MGPVQGGMGLFAACFFAPSPALAAIPISLTATPGQVVVLSALALGGVALGIAAGLWALALARRQWSAIKGAGFPVSYWKQQGRGWEKQA